MAISGFAYDSVSNGVGFVTSNKTGTGTAIYESMSISGVGNRLVGSINIESTNIFLNNIANTTASTTSLGERNNAGDAAGNMSLDRASIIVGDIGGNRTNLRLTNLNNLIFSQANESSLVFIFSYGTELRNSRFTNLHLHQLENIGVVIENVVYINTNGGQLNFGVGRVDRFGIDIASSRSGYRSFLGTGNSGNNGFVDWNPAQGLAIAGLLAFNHSANNYAWAGLTIAQEFVNPDKSKISDVYVTLRDNFANPAGAISTIATWITDSNGRLAGTYDSRTRAAGSNISRPAIYCFLRKSRYTGGSVLISGFSGTTGTHFNYASDVVTVQLVVKSYRHLVPAIQSAPAGQIGRINASGTVSEYSEFILSLDLGVTESNPTTVASYSGISHSTDSFTLSGTLNLNQVYDSRKLYWRNTENATLPGIDGDIARFGTTNITINDSSNAPALTAKYLRFSTNGIIDLVAAGNYSATVAQVPSIGVVTVADGASNLSTWSFASGATINLRAAATAATVTVTSTTGITAGAGVTLVAPVLTVTFTVLNATRIRIDDNAGTLIAATASSGTSFEFTGGGPGQTYIAYAVLPGFVSRQVTFVYPSSSSTIDLTLDSDPNYLAGTWALYALSLDGTGLGTTADISLNPTTRVITMATGLGLDQPSGISMRALASFINEARYRTEALMNRHRPIVAVSATAGEFELRRGWSFGNGATRNLLRDGGFVLFDNAGVVLERWLNVTGLGELRNAATTIGYYVQDAATDAATTNFVNPGQPNQVIQIFGGPSNGNFERTDFLSVYARRIGEAGTRYDLLDAQNLPSLRAQRYFVLLSTATDLLITIAADTEIDANANGIPDVAPYNGMSIAWQDVSEFYPTWTNGFTYPAKAVVGDAGRFWRTALGGTSSGTGVADDAGVVWVAYAGERQINGVWRCFQAITDLNGQGASELRNFHNWANRQSVDIDSTPGFRTGRVEATLSRTEGTRVILARGGYVDDFSPLEQLRITPVDVFGVQREFPPPPNQIVITGIPAVSNAILAVINLTTMAITYPTITGSGAVIELDAATSYLFAADAPGYQRQAVTLAGNTPAFEFTLINNRALYDSGVSLAAFVAFDYSTLEVTITYNAGVTYNFANMYRTIEDYLATEPGVLFPNPPVPLIVDVGGGNGRNYLFFPYDEAADMANPVRVMADPLNTVQPTLTDFVVVLAGAPAPLFDIFDFSNGKVIRFQTEAVSATVNVSGGLSTEDRAVIDDIESYTRPMAKQLGLVTGVTATHTPTAITVSDADGSTTITDNGGGSYTVQKVP